MPVALGGSDPVMEVLTSALDGLSVRQNVIADDIANVDTPGFRGRSADFESSLREAIDSGRAPEETNVELQATNNPVGANDNNVDLRQELLSATQTQFQYQLMTRAVSDRFALVKITAAAQ